ncbi:hypothetical protein KIL84_023274 [Mauremys mutica]|uniref:Uncharacterized protein n=1 Tax=Mauremys mutica TaxID=74926 RepID=A0A9D3WS60_9SAUR|nr:hypothetical protein KIL84_023274 [Mauremys mutica]
MEFIFTPKMLSHLRRKCYISDIPEEKEGAAKGIPLAQLFIDTSEPDSKTQTLVRQNDDCPLSVGQGHRRRLCSDKLTVRSDIQGWGVIG